MSSIQNLGESLDFASPLDVPEALIRVGHDYREAAARLQAYWQDPEAGKIWNDFATILYRAAASAEKALLKRGL